MRRAVKIIFTLFGNRHANFRINEALSLFTPSPIPPLRLRPHPRMFPRA